MSANKENIAYIPPPVPQARLEGANAAMLVLTSVVFLTRVVIRISQRKPYELHDLFCHLAFVSYVVMWILYFLENDPYYRMERVQRGVIPPYPGILRDAGMLWRWVTAHQICFYASLTLAKISILSLYRRLLDRTPKKYTVIWWCILTFCLLSFVASSLSILLVCDDKKTQYKQGICRKPSEQDRVQFSLWLSYAVDVATDLAVMFLPFRLTWSLALRSTQKLGIFVLFGSGWICILFATLRSVQVGVKNGKVSTPEATWTQMWTIIETSMAVIICCAPAFAGIIRRRFGTRDRSYNHRGYVKQSPADITLKGLEKGIGKHSKRKDDTLWIDGHSSQEALADLGGLVSSTSTTTKVEDNGLDSRSGAAS